jgi:hypothetical protein
LIAKEGIKMNRKVLTGMGLIVGLGLVLIAGLCLNTGESLAQQATQKVQKVAPGLKVKQIPKICNKPDLAQWKDNLPLGPKSEFPFSGACKSCWEQVGVMNLPTMSVWITNKGPVNAAATKAKLSWKSGKVPFGEESMKVNVPAIEAGNNYLLTITVPQGKFFQTAKPVKLEIDCDKQVDECNENNNILTFTY